ncbi:MAG: nucleotidyltransferase family protein [Desulforhopalus sp.]
MQAMILAAGLGTRLLPHTMVRPKPLFPILNQPLLLLTVRRLQRLGFDHIVINCHHLREQIITALEGFKGVVLQQEEHILGTGGGLRKALHQLRDEPLFVTNGDIYHTVDITRFHDHHLVSGNKVTLAMHDFPRFNSVAVDGDTICEFRSNEKTESLAFTGLHFIEPSVLEDIESDTFSCIIDHYKSMLSAGESIGIYRVDDCFWTDMGTEKDYLALHKGLLTGTVPCWQEALPVGKPFCIDTRVKVPEDLRLKDWACIGNVQICKDINIGRAVVWDDILLQPGTVLEDTIVSF